MSPLYSTRPHRTIAVASTGTASLLFKAVAVIEASCYCSQPWGKSLECMLTIRSTA